MWSPKTEISWILVWGFLFCLPRLVLNFKLSGPVFSEAEATCLPSAFLQSNVKLRGTPTIPPSHLRHTLQDGPSLTTPCCHGMASHLVPVSWCSAFPFLDSQPQSSLPPWVQPPFLVLPANSQASLVSSHLSFLRSPPPAVGMQMLHFFFFIIRASELSSCLILR